MKKQKSAKVLISIVASFIFFAIPITTNAKENDAVLQGGNNVLAPLILPTISRAEAEAGVTIEGTELPEEFLVSEVKPQLRSAATTGTQKWTKVSTTRKLTKGFIGWHPNWSYYQYNIKGYYFSNGRVGLSFNIGYGPISVSVAKKGTGGQVIPSNTKKWGRPAVYGSINRIKWSVKHYNGGGQYLKTTTSYTNAAFNIFVQTKYK